MAENRVSNVVLLVVLGTLGVFAMGSFS